MSNKFSSSEEQCYLELKISAAPGFRAPFSFLSYLNLFYSPAIHLGWCHHPGAGGFPSPYCCMSDLGTCCPWPVIPLSPLWTLDPGDHVLKLSGYSQDQSQYPWVTLMDAWEQPVSQVWGLLALCNTQPLSTEAGGDKGLKLFKYWVQCFEILLSKL